MDAKAYLDWLNQQSTDKSKGEWRLPTEAEWEYAARGGSKAISAYSWGNEESVCDLSAPNGAQFTNCKEWAPLKVGSFTQNKHPFGLFGMHGNVWEWVEDCGIATYDKTPMDGSAYQGCGADAPRVLRGGSWLSLPGNLRSASRRFDYPFPWDEAIGFRVARTN